MLLEALVDNSPAYMLSFASGRRLPATKRSMSPFKFLLSTVTTKSPGVPVKA
jgi:hypothetical protein